MSELNLVRSIDIAILAICLPLVYFTLYSGFILIAIIMLFVITKLAISYVGIRKSFLDKVNASKYDG